jgi:hypothetical protein
MSNKMELGVFPQFPFSYSFYSLFMPPNPELKNAQEFLWVAL